MRIELSASTPNSPGSPGQQDRIPRQERRRRRRDWRIAGAVAVVLVLVLAFERNIFTLYQGLPIGSAAVFLTLVHINVIGIAVLVFFVARNVVKLVVERRRGIMGAKLHTRFVGAFVFMAAVSTTALFAFSAIFVSRAIDEWFSVQLSESLEHAVEVGEAYYQEAEENALYFGRRIAGDIESRKLLRESALTKLQAFVGEKQLEYQLGVVEIFSAQQEKLATATHPDVAIVALEAPDSELIQAGLSGVERVVVQAAGAGELIRGVVPVYSTFNDGHVVGVVVVNEFIPRAMGRRMTAINAALAAYRRMEPGAGTFQTSMLLLLALITLLSLLFSSWLGFRLAKQITVPIRRLAEATEEVAAGNLKVQVEHGGDDEIGSLVSAFNRMASDLATSREDIERRRAQMEILLRSVAAGVISLDEEGTVITINPSAIHLLDLPRSVGPGRKVVDVLGGAALETLDALMRRVGSGPQRTVRRQVQLQLEKESRTLNWTVSRLQDADSRAAGYVVVIDDVSQILKAQRMAAWRDVARRIAHEIKNPLTPIQLSAQRLRRKLDARLDDAESKELLRECTDAITSQVGAIKHLVAEFSSFAQFPATDPVPTDLNKLITDAVLLYKGRRGIQLETDLAKRLPELDLDPEQIKRVILNLIENALHAVLEAEGEPKQIQVSTRWDGAVGKVYLEVADTGCGVRPEDAGRIFEPDFSTKRDGSGLGLAIVGRIVSDHSGYVRVRDNHPRGTRFIIELPTRT